MLVRSPSVLPEIEDMGITSPSRSFMQQRRPSGSTRFCCTSTLKPPWASSHPLKPVRQRSCHLPPDSEIVAKQPDPGTLFGFVH
ncbi:MAG: hypothetical protein VB125_02890 [Burkholderia sp.]